MVVLQIEKNRKIYNMKTILINYHHYYKNNKLFH